MLSVVLRVPNGPPAKPRNGRSWRSIAAETWGTDILREKSYIWLLASRLFILMGGAAVLNFIYLYLADAHGLTQEQSGGAFGFMLLAAVGVSLLAIVPASRLSDRFGRKPVIYVCTALGAIGVGIIALAPSIPIAILGSAMFGASQGTFLAVDWALMTDIIPRASSGRYMGLSNVVTASSTTIAIIFGGPLIDFVNKAAGTGSGPRLEFLFGVGYFVVGALLLRPVVEPDRRTATRAAAPGLICSSLRRRRRDPSAARQRVVRSASRGAGRASSGARRSRDRRSLRYRSIRSRHQRGRSQPNGSGWRQSTGTSAHRKTM